MQSMITIGDNIKKYREQNLMTQKQLAQIIGVTDKAISNWERGIRAPKMGQMRKMASAFGIKISLLMGENDSLANENLSKVKWVPIVEKLPCEGSVITLNDVVGFEAIPSDLLIDSENCIFYRSADDSHYPNCIKNDLVLIALKNSVQSGGIALVSIDGDAPKLKKLLFKNETVVLKGKCLAEDKVFKGKELRALSVLGEVKRIVRNF
ncbi:MAG: helix-turn-helix domain-containing protein [Clostridia bacterium]|nr:helix-turn-helix domain-containing protein [Clostridia bacterium]